MKTTRIERSAMVLHPASLLFDLVNDIEAYPEFMDGCRAARVLSRADDEVVARLDLARGGIHQSFATRNRLVRPTAIIMELEEGPFTRLHGEWRFKALTDSACKVSLILEFQFKSGLARLAANKLFTQVANNLVAATVARADVVAADKRQPPRATTNSPARPKEAADDAGRNAAACDNQ